MVSVFIKIYWDIQTIGRGRGLSLICTSIKDKIKISDFLGFVAYLKLFIFIGIYSKMVSWCSPMHKEGNELCIIYTLIYGCYHGLESVL